LSKSCLLLKYHDDLTLPANIIAQAPVQFCLR
jgi:hypothetical protein